ncbi:MAG: DUF459 domain-containing protein [Actinomycetes bacterium]
MSTDDHTPGRRAAARHRRDGRRRRIRTVVGTTAALLLLLAGTAGALVATGRAPWPRTEGAGPDRPVDVEHPPIVDPADPSTRDQRRRALSPEAPLRLWIAGDSLAGSLGPSLGNLTASTGVVAPVYDSRVSSGLANPSFFNWPKHAASELARLRPEAVAFIIGTNDFPIVSGKQVQGSAWATDYAARTEAMMRLLVGPQQRTVFWISPPIVRDTKMAAALRQIGEVQRTVARRFPTVVWIDAYSLFDDAQGEYASRVVDEDGETISVRAGDGVHFSPEGGDYLARVVFGEIDQLWRIEDQADPTRPQRVIETKGSSYVAGTRRSTTSTTSTGSSGTTSTTSDADSSSTTTSSTSSTSTTVPTTTTTTAAVPQGGGRVGPTGPPG